MVEDNLKAIDLTPPEHSSAARDIKMSLIWLMLEATGILYTIHLLLLQPKTQSKRWRQG
ncbi:MAG TPA: hypothetical protein VKA09_07200 [Nitrososphaeraceae archaeon]|nr:hypothetical protein [Nitrososphaeraceae archaeon]